jgi:inner membrane protein
VRYVIVVYKVPVYTATVHILGEFNIANEVIENVDTSEFDIDEAYVQIPLGNPRTIKESVIFTWNNEEMNLSPRLHNQVNDGVTLTANLPTDKIDKETAHQFEMEMKLAGSNEINFLSFSPKTTIKINANWGSPSFFGHEKNEWISANKIGQEESFGIRLLQPVDTYKMVTRAAKYSILFISLTFLVYFFTEVMAGLSLHTVQYFLVGGAICIFYLLLLSLAEHINFTLAYIISTVASVSLISLYSISILKSRFKALVMFLLLSGIYGYLYVTLRSEAFALLIGSLGLFIVLGTSMYMTRNFDWNKAASHITR